MIQPFKNIMQAFLHMHFIQFNMYKFCANILDMIQFFSSHNPIKRGDKKFEYETNTAYTLKSKSNKPNIVCFK